MNERVDREPVAFGSGGVTLAGYLYRPASEPAGAGQSDPTERRPGAAGRRGIWRTPDSSAVRVDDQRAVGGRARVRQRRARGSGGSGSTAATMSVTTWATASTVPNGSTHGCLSQGKRSQIYRGHAVAHTPISAVTAGYRTRPTRSHPVGRAIRPSLGR